MEELDSVNMAILILGKAFEKEFETLKISK